MTYATAVTQLASLLASETSTNIVHSDPPESLGQFPCWVVQWVRGEGGYLAGGVTDEVVTLGALLYISRQVLPIQNSTVRGYIQEFTNMMQAYRTLNGGFNDVVGWRWEGPTGLTYGGQTHLGIRFEIVGRFNEAY